MSDRRDDGLAKGLGMAMALGALAVGVAAAVMNNERTRQMREEMKVRLDELGRRVDDLTAEAQRRMDEMSSQVQRTIEERRPEIEQTIQKSREAVLGGLDRARSVVEQGADRAQEYVQRTGTQGQQTGDEATADGDTADGGASGASASGSDLAASARDVSQTEMGSMGDAVGASGDGGQSGDSGMDGTTTVRDWTGDAARQLDEAMSEEGEQGDTGADAGGSTSGPTQISMFGDDMGGYSGDTGGSGDSGSEGDGGSLMANTGDASLDALRSDDLSTSSQSNAVGGEDMSGDGDHIEQAAQDSGFQLQGQMHSHGAGEASQPARGAETGPLGEANVDVTRGQQTRPFRDSTLTDNDVDNEPPVPGDSRTV